MLQAIVEMGGFVQAAQALNRSQSAVSYAVNTLQEQLGVQLLEIKGRKAVLTSEGRALLRRASEVLVGLAELEEFSQRLKQGLESELWVNVDSYFPAEVLMAALQEFRAFNSSTKLQIRESLMCRTPDDAAQEADVVIGTKIPDAGFGDLALSVPLQAVAAAAHPIHAASVDSGRSRLSAHTQITVCESGTLNQADHGWMSSHSRWVASSIQQAIELVRNGIGYAWLPAHMVCDDLEIGVLRQLGLPASQVRTVQLYITVTAAHSAGPASRKFAEIVRRRCLIWREAQSQRSIDLGGAPLEI